ncbi:MAG TPA: 3-oxoacyl-[acyl-carrier-protein] reductase [Candidatus Omnitrophota bacterium]|nr:3-oxoacyl-[acyl-carrier-protein] reductase [Candidatus Omnitrophota bacterium]
MLKDKVALVTGAGRGIGQAIALAFAKEGAILVLSDLKTEFLTETEALAKQAGSPKCLLTQANVANGDEVDQVVKIALDTFERIDILVNVAGITKDGLLATMSEQDWDDVLSINLKSAFLFTKACARPMMKQRSGAVINIASIIGIAGNAGQANYAASKGGMIALTKSTAKELAKRNIRANAIAPGFIKTKMTDKLPPDLVEKMKEQIGLKRLGEPQDVANVAVFLASEASAYVTGQTIVVDGGLVL